jgi:hypothetical protein
MHTLHTTWITHNSLRINSKRDLEHMNLVSNLLSVPIEKTLFSNTPSEEQKHIKVLLLENVHSSGISLFEELGCSLEALSTSLSEEKLKEKLQDVHILGIRSKTQITRDILEYAPNLLAIGCFCIGTNQVDTDEAEMRGVIYFFFNFFQ